VTISELTVASLSKRVFVQNLLYLNGDEQEGETHLHMNGFAGGLVLTKREMAHSLGHNLEFVVFSVSK